MVIAEETPVGPTIELPKFVVTDSRELPQPESWRYATIPGFEILSNASDRTTKQLIKDFEMFRMALGVVWPMPERPTAPTSLILCGRGGKFNGFVPSGKDSGVEMARASEFLKSGNRTAIVLDLESKALSILPSQTDDPASGSDSSQLAIDHNKQLYREYVRYLLSKSEPRLPAWFEEGMLQIIMAMKFEPTYIEFGKLEDPNTVSARASAVAQMNALAATDSFDFSAPLAGAPTEDRDFSAALQRRALMPLDKFFAIDHDAPEAVNPLGNNLWAKQAYAFVHMCLYGEHGKYQKAFGQFIARSTREPVTETMFEECFNFPDKKGVSHPMSYRDMLVELRGFIDFAVYDSKEYHAKRGGKLPQPAPLELRDATQSEIGRIEGEALVLAGHDDMARAELIAPYIRGERDPALLAALGLYEHANNRDDRARKFLEAAAAGKAVRPDAYLLLAQFHYADAIAKPGRSDGKFSPRQITSIIDPLVTALQQPPSLPGVYELMADTWMHNAAKTKKEEAGILFEGAQLFPGHLRLIYEAALLCADADLIEAAHSLAEYGAETAPEGAPREKFERLNATLPPVPEAVPATDAPRFHSPGAR